MIIVVHLHAHQISLEEIILICFDCDNNIHILKIINDSVARLKGDARIFTIIFQLLFTHELLLFVAAKIVIDHF